MGRHTIFYLTEKCINTPAWFSQAVNGLKNAAAKQKFSVMQASSIAEIPSYTSSAILIGRSHSWFEKMIAEVRRARLNPIIIGGSPKEFGEDVSGVVYDIRTIVTSVLSYFHDTGHSRIALVGVREENSLDAEKIRAFSDACRMQGLESPENDIYRLIPDLPDSLDVFWSNIRKYDAVLCSTDFCGTLVLKKARELGIAVPGSLFVCGMGNSMLCHCSSPELTSVTWRYYDSGVVAFSIWKTFYSSSLDVSSVLMTMKSRIVPRESTQNMLPDDGCHADEHREPVELTHPRYDRNIMTIMEVQKCLFEMDALDLKILEGVLRGESNELISEKASVSPGTVSYRLKKIYSQANVSTKAELADFFGDVDITMPHSP